jgi:NAD(P)-dependent dehydrogenase (short-subunit alcohol dehydrogenase family)
LSRIFITGSADGLGVLTAKSLIAKGHKVLLHARNENRGKDAVRAAAGAEGVVTADLSNMSETIELADKLNALGKFDAVIHNAGVYKASAKELFMVNTLAPYILTCLVEKPKRLIYLSSDMHMGGRSKLESFQTSISQITYSDTKLHVLLLSKAIARKWPDVYSNAVNPGWVPTKMGGRGARDDLQQGYETQVWLAVSNDKKALVSGKYFFHQQATVSNLEADDSQMQERFLSLCGEISGVSFPYNDKIVT